MGSPRSWEWSWRRLEEIHPVEMLVDLVISDEMDPWQIDIAEIASRFLEKVREMVDLNLQAIAARDVKPTEELSKKDDLVDALYEQVYKELLTFMIKDPKTIDDATHLLIVALYLERIGDIACTTGSRIVYMIEGRRVWIK